MRHWLPDQVGGVFWFGVDDATFSVHVPFYPHCTKIPPSFATAQTGTVTAFNFDSMFWLNNLVANRVYAQWEILAPLVGEKVAVFEKEFFEEQNKIEKIALNMIEEEPDLLSSHGDKYSQQA